VPLSLSERGWRRAVYWQVDPKRIDGQPWVAGTTGAEGTWWRSACVPETVTVCGYCHLSAVGSSAEFTRLSLASQTNGLTEGSFCEPCLFSVTPAGGWARQVARGSLAGIEATAT
jgi:hypothetical protein